VTRPEPLPDIWFSRDLPVLREVARRLEEQPDVGFNVVDVADTLQLTFEVAARAGQRLKDDGYLDGMESAEHGVIGFTNLTAKGLREVGQWPSPDTAADRLLAALEAAVEKAPTEEAKSHAKRILDGFRSAGRDFLVDVASGVVTGQIG
jgi:hypothetical protein